LDWKSFSTLGEFWSKVEIMSTNVFFVGTLQLLAATVSTHGAAGCALLS